MIKHIKLKFGYCIALTLALICSSCVNDMNTNKHHSYQASYIMYDLLRCEERHIANILYVEVPAQEVFIVIPFESALEYANWRNEKLDNFINDLSLVGGVYILDISRDAVTATSVDYFTFSEIWARRSEDGGAMLCLEALKPYLDDFMRVEELDCDESISAIP